MFFFTALIFTKKYLNDNNFFNFAFLQCIVFANIATYKFFHHQKDLSVLDCKFTCFFALLFFL